MHGLMSIQVKSEVFSRIQFSLVHFKELLDVQCAFQSGSEI